MNLREQLLKVHSKPNTMRIVKWIGTDAGRFRELVTILLGNDPLAAQRAAWVLGHATEAHPGLAKPHLGKLIRNLGNKDQHDAIVRNTLRFLQTYDVPEKYLGELTDISFRLLMNVSSPIAVRAFAMVTLRNICRREPGLKNELKAVVEEVIPHASAGLLNCSKKTLKFLEKLPDTGGSLED